MMAAAVPFVSLANLNIASIFCKQFLNDLVVYCT